MTIILSIQKNKTHISKTHNTQTSRQYYKHKVVHKYKPLAHKQENKPCPRHIFQVTIKKKLIGGYKKVEEGVEV